MASSPKYVPVYTEVFLQCLENYRDKQERVLELVERICEAPKIPQAHFLTVKKGVDLHGKAMGKYHLRLEPLSRY